MSRGSRAWSLLYHRSAGKVSYNDHLLYTIVTIIKHSINKKLKVNGQWRLLWTVCVAMTTKIFGEGTKAKSNQVDPFRDFHTGTFIS